jgi:pimeloyl-ACP methyl ester carboxylesterase
MTRTPLASARIQGGASAVQFADISWGNRRDSIEYGWLNGAADTTQLMVFLHEGLGSLATWKIFPEEMCAALGWRGLVFSRWGYGASSARPAGVKWPQSFMHEQASQFLPALFAVLGIDTLATKPWFFGHSDGGSIALVFAALYPAHTGGLIVAAPHVFVEEISVASIAQTRDAYLHGDLRARLARYHADPDSAFWGWNDIWLDPAFRAWSIEDLLNRITCPVLAVQGLNDEYGTLAQIKRIGSAVLGSELLELAQCGHAPHRDQRDALIAATRDFIARRG